MQELATSHATLASGLQFQDFNQRALSGGNAEPSRRGGVDHDLAGNDAVGLSLLPPCLGNE